jgi:hypothetical protein
LVVWVTPLLVWFAWRRRWRIVGSIRALRCGSML